MIFRVQLELIYKEKLKKLESSPIQILG